MYNEAELAHWFRNKDSKILIPSSVDIDLTNICNQDCYYCNSADFRKNSPVQKNYLEYILLLDKLASWRAHTPNSYGTTHTVTYPGGGEPTILKNYEKVIEHTIDLGFLTSITTNGSKLNKLLENVPVKKLQKIGWIGIDIDAGTEELYEKIRNSLTKKSLFEKVKQNAIELTKAGVNVDIKALLNPYNDTQEDILNLFQYVKEVGARQIYIRPLILNGKAHPVSEQSIAWMELASKTTNVPYKINLNKFASREYKLCHQMFHFPVFCADGNIYSCCEHKGDARFNIGSWDQGDFRDDCWMKEQHWNIYNRTIVDLCPPCRPNKVNNTIQKILDNPSLIEVLYL